MNIVYRTRKFVSDHPFVSTAAGLAIGVAAGYSYGVRGVCLTLTKDQISILEEAKNFIGYNTKYGDYAVMKYPFKK